MASKDIDFSLVIRRESGKVKLDSQESTANNTILVLQALVECFEQIEEESGDTLTDDTIDRLFSKVKHYRSQKQPNTTN